MKAKQYLMLSLTVWLALSGAAAMGAHSDDRDH
jgi:hypothetical protein